VQNTVNDNLAFFDLKKCPLVPGSHPVFWNMVGEPLDVPRQIIFKPAKALDHSTSVLGCH
jgi:hypothetical protein